MTTDLDKAIKYLRRAEKKLQRSFISMSIAIPIQNDIVKAKRLLCAIEREQRTGQPPTLLEDEDALPENIEGNGRAGL